MIIIPFAQTICASAHRGRIIKTPAQQSRIFFNLFPSGSNFNFTQPWPFRQIVGITFGQRTDWILRKSGTKKCESGLKSLAILSTP